MNVLLISKDVEALPETICSLCLNEIVYIESCCKYFSYDAWTSFQAVIIIIISIVSYLYTPTMLGLRSCYNVYLLAITKNIAFYNKHLTLTFKKIKNSLHKGSANISGKRLCNSKLAIETTP